jgi:hypothetical protein
MRFFVSQNLQNLPYLLCCGSGACLLQSLFRIVNHLADTGLLDSNRTRSCISEFGEVSRYFIIFDTFAAGCLNGVMKLAEAFLLAEL